jgi:hypothetical protein
MSAPSRRHCSAIAGAGSPPQAPGSTDTASPIRPAPSSVGAASSTGAIASGSAAATVTRKRLTASPPELPAVTMTSRPSRRVSVAMRTSPVAGSMLTPVPVTRKLRLSPVKSEAAFTV